MVDNLDFVRLWDEVVAEPDSQLQSVSVLS